MSEPSTESLAADVDRLAKALHGNGELFYTEDDHASLCLAAQRLREQSRHIDQLISQLLAAGQFPQMTEEDVKAMRDD